jgi:hypothetical protein
MDIFTGIFGLVIGFVSIWAGVRILRLYFKVNKWNRVEAKITSKSVTIHERYSSSRSPYKVNATYVYKINGLEFTGTRIYLPELLGGQANYMKQDADRRLERIQETMTVYVDPVDEKNSVMYCSGVFWYVIAIFMGIFSILFGISKLV